ncbi:hypothetical protein Tco_0062666 [Tanacetum coccineum]
MESQSETSQTVSALKLLVLKYREYDLWSMRMEQYLNFTNHALWNVIVNGDSVTPVALASTGAEAIPDEHLLKFHAYKDAKSLWEAIKNSQEGLDKTYDRFQKLISQLEIHGEVISQEDANLKFSAASSKDQAYSAYSVFAASSKDQASTTSYANDVMFSFFANQSNAPQLDYEDLE